MVQSICLALVVMAFLAETTALHQWRQQYVPAGVEQATAGGDFSAWPRRPQ